MTCCLENESIEAPSPPVNKPLGYLRKLVRSDSNRKSPHSGLQAQGRGHVLSEATR